MSIDENRGVTLESKTKRANSVDHDKTAHYQPSQLDLHCLHWYLFWPAMLKGLGVMRNFGTNKDRIIATKFWKCSALILNSKWNRTARPY